MKGGVQTLIMTAIMLVVVLAAFVIYTFFFPCIYMPGGKLICPLGGFTIEESFYIQKTSYKTNLFMYTLLSTKINGLSFENCTKFLDCIEETEEEICKEIYGDVYSKEECVNFMNETLKKIWDKRIRIYGNGFDIIANEHIYLGEKAITKWYVPVPPPKNYIPITLEVYI